MTYFKTAAIAAQSGKFGAVMNSRISKPHIQTLFEAADKIMPTFKAAAGIERMKAVMDTPAMLVMRALSPVSVFAGRGVIC